MADHYGCIGFQFSDRRAWQEGVAALTASSERDAGDTYHRLLWSDGSGACHATFVDGAAIVCAKPTFDGRSSVHARIGATVADAAGCPMCSLSLLEVLEGGETAYPLAVELDDAHRGGLVPEGAEVDLVIVGFGEHVQRWQSEDAYHHSVAREEPRFAVQSLIPSGLFRAGGSSEVRAEALITGIVREAARLRNGSTGRAFDWALVETFGAAVDVVVAAAEAPLAVGNVVQGTFWLVAHR